MYPPVRTSGCLSLVPSLRLGGAYPLVRCFLVSLGFPSVSLGKGGSLGCFSFGRRRVLGGAYPLVRAAACSDRRVRPVRAMAEAAWNGLEKKKERRRKEGKKECTEACPAHPDEGHRDAPALCEPEPPPTSKAACEPKGDRWPTPLPIALIALSAYYTQNKTRNGHTVPIPGFLLGRWRPNESIPYGAEDSSPAAATTDSSSRGSAIPTWDLPTTL